MTPESIRLQSEEYLAKLADLADRTDPAVFLEEAPDGGWTLGQIFDHLIHSCMALHIPQAEACLEGRGGPGRKRFATAVIFWMDRFPRAQIHPSRKVRGAMPGGWEPRNLTRREAMAGIEVLARRMEALLARLPEADPAIKTAYGPLGALNAFEWVQMVPMHLRHHLEGQIARRLAARPAPIQAPVHLG